MVGALVLVVVGIAVAQAPEETEDPLVSYDERAAPAFDLPGSAQPGQNVSLAATNRPVVLNIWASWCVPCRREMPVLQAAHTAYGDRVAFIGINHQDQRGAALDFLRSAGVTYPSGFDPAGSTARSYGAFGVPTTYFITSSDRIIAAKTGELTEPELSSEIQRLLAEGT